MKRFICIFMTLILVLALSACGKSDDSDISDTSNVEITDSVQEEQSTPSNNSVSTPDEFIGIDTDAGYYIDEYTGSANIIVVPEELDGKKVVGIEHDAFYGDGFEEITFSSGITEVEDSTFSNMLNLKKVVLNEGLTRIGDDAFVNCESLSEIVIPSTLKSIGNYAFVECHSLAAVELPEGLTEIGYTVFGNCAFETFTFPSTVIYLYDKVIENCENLKDVYILGSETQFEDYAIDDCPNAVIHGYSGSTAETYALNMGMEFIAM